MPIKTTDFQCFKKRKPLNAILLNVINGISDNSTEILHVSSELASSLGLNDSPSFVAIRSAPGRIPKFGWTLFSAFQDDSLTGVSCLLRSNSIFFTGNHHIQIIHTNPIRLDRLILTFPSKLYGKLYADDDSQVELRNKLYSNHGLIRQGETFIDVGCRVSLCEPMDQGIIDESTIISIVRDEMDKSELDESTGGYSDSDLDDVELTITKYLESMPEPTKETDFSDIIAAVSLDPQNISSTVLRPIPLEHALHPGSIIPSPQLHEDMESIGFVKTERLARMGLFSGDVVKLPACNGRCIKLYSYPEPNTIPNDVIYLSPLLLHNLHLSGDLELVTSTSETSLTKLVPICGEVTIARVASPVTTDRAYQSAFLSGLRSYFENCHRIVCIDDLIAIPIDTVLAQTLASQQSSASKISDSIPTGKPDNVAWFKVTNALNKTGEVITGCAFIDPRITRMIQSGLVDSKIISTQLPWREYTGLNKLFQFDSSDKNFAHYAKLEKILTTSVSAKKLRTSVLLDSSKRGTGKTTCVQSACAKLGIHLYEIDCYQLIGEGDTKTIGILKARLERAASIRPCAILLKHIEAISGKSDQDGSDSGISANVAESLDEAFKNGLTIIATTSDTDKMSEAVRSKFVFEIHVSVPSESERTRLLEYLVDPHGPALESRSLTLRHNERANIFSGYRIREDVQIGSLALQSAGLTPPDLLSIIEAAKVEAEARISGFDNDIDCLIASRGAINIIPEDLEAAVSNARAKYSDAIGVPRIPNVQWSDVGGLEGVKKDILDSIEMPLKHPHLFSTGVKKRSGILFYGPPGTGKTLLAKAIATNFSLNFFSVKGPELLNMYIGESEANVRKVFQRARDARPCVVFFDELDSVAPKRGNQGDSGGVMDRIVSQLLSELDGMSGSGGEGVFVVGATNRPDLLDEALLRPGRFDKLLYLGISDTHEKQETILQALTRKFTLDEKVSLKDIAGKCPFTYTGADFYALCSDALLNAMTRTAGEVDEKLKLFNEKRVNEGETAVSIRWWFQNIAKETDYAVSVTEKDFIRAQNMLVPSVSADELEHYLHVRANFEQTQETGQKNKGKGKQKT